METLRNVGEQLVQLTELVQGLRTRIDMIATTPSEQRKKDQDLQVWAKHIDEAVTKAIRAYNE